MTEHLRTYDPAAAPTAVVHGHSGTEEQRAWHMTEAKKKVIVTPQVAAPLKNMTPFAIKK